MIELVQFKKVFCTTAAWKQKWSNVQKLVMLPIMNSQVHNNSPSNFQGSFIGNVPQLLISRFEISLIALLWCEGSMQDKAIFLSQLINPKQEKFIHSSQPELKTAFKKLLYYSIDLPKLYYQKFSPLRLDDKHANAVTQEGKSEEEKECPDK